MHDSASSAHAIAVVGIGCQYPGARDLRELWENIIARRRQFRRMPDVRLPLADYHDPDPAAPDKTYGTRAALIDGFVCDWQQRFIPQSTYETADIAHWLALETALKTLADAGLSRQNVASERSGVILGNTLTGEHTRATAMRQRWPFVRKSLIAAASARGIAGAGLDGLVATMQDYYQSVFAPTTEDSLSGALSNTIAGRICNHLNFHGGGYTVDGACSSSLIAVATAATALVNRDMDFVLAGGVDVSLDTFELIGFAKTGALTRGDMSVYDRRASGFIPGEGCGFVALKRLADARAAGDRVYAVLRGWGISSDGKGGLTAPSRDGQAKALRRAYERAGYAAASVDFFEGHGTGTPVGDRVEIEGIAQAVGTPAAGAVRAQGLTSFKSLVGHTKAAAGVGGFIKAVLAVNRRVLPPTCGCQEPSAVFDERAPGLFPLMYGERRAADAVLRAGVSAMGFGGINCHVTLESGDAPVAELVGELDERALMAHAQDSELMVMAAGSAGALVQRVDAVVALVAGISLAEMADVAAVLGSQLAAGAWRAGVLASTPDELLERLAELRAALAQAGNVAEVQWSNPTRTVWFGAATAPARTAFVFPGQGSQQLLMARVLIERHAWARDLAAQAERWLAEVGCVGVVAAICVPLDRAADPAQRDAWAGALARTEMAQPAICLASLLWLQQLGRLGLQAEVVAGHSLGELTALHAAGAFDAETLLKLAALRGRAMAASAADAGGMASRACDAPAASRLLAQVDGYLVIANRNSTRQTVVSGETGAIDAVVVRAQAEGITAKRLAVSNAFHSRFVDAAAIRLGAEAPVPARPQALRLRLHSGIAGQVITAQLPLREHVGRQIAAPVDFVAITTQLAREVDHVIEVGPGRVLSGLMRDTLDRELCLPVAARPGNDRDLQAVLARAFCGGQTIAWAELHRDRLIRPFTPTAHKSFIDNPCERPFRPTQAWTSLALTAGDGGTVATLAALSGTDAGVLGDYLARRGAFLGQVIRADLDLPGLSQPAVTAAVPPSTARVVATVSTALPAAPSAALPSTTQAIEIRLMALVAARTGFALAGIRPTLRLLDDLNLDSIKAAELVGSAARELDIASGIDPSLFANATLHEVAEALRSVLPVGVASAPLPQAVTATTTDGAAIGSLLLDLVAQRTGFARAGLNLGLRLLDDLNLDSIKAGELVAAGAKAIGLTAAVDASLYANATLGDIARAFAELLAPVASASPLAPPVEVSDWVRCFRMELVPEPLAAMAGDGLRGARVLLLHEESEADLVAVLRAALLAAAAEVRSCTYAAALGTDVLSDPQYSHRIGLLCREDAAQPRLDLAVARLHAIATVARAHVGGAQPLLAIVQFGAGGTAGLAQAGAGAFAASLHLERPDLRVRVIDADPALPVADLAPLVVAELAGSARHVRASYDLQRTRRVPRSVLAEPVSWSPRDLAWNSSDVVLVTGGARGITAACALAQAQATGVRMALVGSSPAGEEVRATLARFHEAGHTARYYQCDVVDAKAVDGLVADVRRELGAITGLIHGAAINKPRRADQATAAVALAEVGPKVQGALNLLTALASAPPRLIVGFSSIIGISGMAGNAWYAFSNETLAHLLRTFAHAHPGTAVISLAYSVWAEVGMGARMGSDQHLARLGIGAIPPRDGIDRFLRLVSHDPGSSEVIISAPLGGLDTWIPLVPAKPVAARYLDEVQGFIPGVELRVRTRLTLARDPYVADHIYKDSALFPTVFGLEAMAQAAAWVLGVPVIAGLTIEDIRLERPIVVYQQQGTLIALRARVEERADHTSPYRVHVGITSEATGFARDHFAATLVFAAPVSTPAGLPVFSAQPLPIDPRQDLYSWLLFQGPRFQRLRHIHTLDSHICTFTSEQRDYHVAADGEETYLLGDPYFRDSLLQAPQLTVSQQLSLPVHIARIELHVWQSDAAARPAPLARQGEAVFDGAVPGNDRQLLAHVTVADEHGRLLERITGYRLAVLERRDDHPTPEQIADPDAFDSGDLRQRLDHAASALGVRAPFLTLAYGDWHGPDRAARRLAERPLLTATLAAADLVGAEVVWAADHRPSLAGVQGFGVSVAHDERACLVVVGAGDQGCDVAPVTHRQDHDDWLALIGSANAPLLSALVAGGDGLDIAGTRLWAAAEAVRKAGGGVILDLAITTRRDTAVLLSGATASGGRLAVLTLPWCGRRGPQRLIAVVVGAVAATPVVAVPPAPSETAQPEGFAPHVYGMRFDHALQGQLAFTLRFPLTFRETAHLSRNLYFSHFAMWMGKLREAACQPVYAALVEQFSSGRWGMVTNRSETCILGSASTCDVIEGRVWLDRVYGPSASTMDLCYEWSAERASGERVLLGRSKMTATWVEILDHGLVAARPFPAYYQEFITRIAPVVAAEQPWEVGASAGLGAVVRQSVHGPVGRVVLHEQRFHTTLEDANLVGNIYFANYYIWQGRIVDTCFQRMAPELLRGVGAAGELRCTYTKVDHLREAMPFDTILVRIALVALHSQGVHLHVDYFREGAEGQLTKLAWGEHHAQWFKSTADGQWLPAALPQVLVDGCLRLGTPSGDAAEIPVLMN